jgi:hypothetical protein
MASINRLKPGQFVYEKRRVRAGNTMMSRDAVYRVLVKEVDLEKRRVFASWNSNPARWYDEHVWKGWRVKEPQVKRSPWGI